MKKLFIIVIFFISLQSWAKADDIQDFQIEGMSVGDSLLDYMSINQIKNSKRNYFKDKRKYYVVARVDNLENYEVVDLYLKTGDQKYIIRTIGGIIELDKDMCFTKKKQIAFELEKIFPNIKKEEFDKAHEYDKSKKSRQYQTVFFLKKTKKANDPHIRVECSVWSDEVKKKDYFSDSLNVFAMTTEILNWIYSGYK
ncbi:MAG: hypothetical protein O2935_03580 [Proteobacteria bacterium]|nr:hypothetical protein [Pseudomonadota bacterium]